MERWAKKQAKNKETARPQATAQPTQDMVKESTYQYDPNDLKVCRAVSEVLTKPVYTIFQTERSSIYR